MIGKYVFGVTFLVTTLSMSFLSAQGIRHLDTNNNGIYEEGEVDPCQEYISGNATCTYPVTRFKKCEYCTYRCCWEPYCVPKKCCRYVDQHYTRQHCRYVPQYYTKTYCRKVPEYYCVNETKYRRKYIKDNHCYYKPYTYCKTECREMCPDQGSCP